MEETSIRDATKARLALRIMVPRPTKLDNQTDGSQIAHKSLATGAFLFFAS
jgi:hypothetical protein